MGSEMCIRDSRSAARKPRLPRRTGGRRSVTCTCTTGSATGCFWPLRTPPLRSAPCLPEFARQTQPCSNERKQPWRAVGECRGGLLPEASWRELCQPRSRLGERASGASVVATLAPRPSPLYLEASPPVAVGLLQLGPHTWGQNDIAAPHNLAPFALKAGLLQPAAQAIGKPCKPAQPLRYCMQTCPAGKQAHTAAGATYIGGKRHSCPCPKASLLQSTL